MNQLDKICPCCFNDHSPDKFGVCVDIIKKYMDPNNTNNDKLIKANELMLHLHEMIEFYLRERNTLDDLRTLIKSLVNEAIDKLRTDISNLRFNINNKDVSVDDIKNHISNVVYDQIIKKGSEQIENKEIIRNALNNKNAEELIKTKYVQLSQSISNLIKINLEKFTISSKKITKKHIKNKIIDLKIVINLDMLKTFVAFEIGIPSILKRHIKIDNIDENVLKYYSSMYKQLSEQGKLIFEFPDELETSQGVENIIDISKNKLFENPIRYSHWLPCDYCILTYNYILGLENFKYQFIGLSDK